MKNAQQDEAFAIKAVSKDVARVQYLKHELAVFRASLNRAADERMFGENTRLQLDFSRNDFCKARIPVVKKSGKAVEIGERSSRPIKLHRPFQGLNEDVPQVSSQRTTSSCATV